MPTREDVKRSVCEAIDRRAEKIIAVGESIRRNPELGFKEVKTARLVADTIVMPALHPYMGGATGSGHGADYAIASPALAYVEPAKQLALMAVDLFWGDAGAAREILAGWKPRMTKAEYLAFQRGVARTELFDGSR